MLDEIQVAKVRRDEIETNLAKLRDPSLAILPEHFIWQPLPEGSLTRIPDWLRPANKGKRPKRLELVAGATTYAIEPSWPTDARDPLVALRDAINNAGTPVKARIEAVIKGAEVALVLESRRNPPLQLRETPGRPETNLLEGELQWKCSGCRVIPLSRWLSDWSDVCFDYPMLKETWLGVLVTWMLLSLGAPFWYDALKNLLKLRSTLATKEEIARNERQADQTGTSKPAASK